VPGKELHSPPRQKLLGTVTSRGPSRKSYTPSQKSSDWPEAPEATAIAWFAISTANEIRRKVLARLPSSEVLLHISGNPTNQS
jgi:hypothetical protein